MVAVLYNAVPPCKLLGRTMWPKNLLPQVALGVLAFVGGALVATSCVQVDYGTVAFRCNPRQDDNCPEDFKCCSDDPAAYGDDIPKYQGFPNEGGVPFFSDLTNDLSTSGMCVRTDDLASLPPGGKLGNNCPVPCDPTWGADVVATICGAGRQCCQTRPIEASDCVRDQSTIRPVTGADIGDTSIQPPTTWTPGTHATAQDSYGQSPGTGCQEFAALLGGDTDDILAECAAKLSVANRRGFCKIAELGMCPEDVTSYCDACEALAGMCQPSI